MTVIDRLITPTYRPICKDRAAVVTAAILQIIETAPAAECGQCVESYLRDEFFDIARQAANEIRHND